MFLIACKPKQEPQMQSIDTNSNEIKSFAKGEFAIVAIRDVEYLANSYVKALM